jgi:hypothetical protein
VLMCFRFDWARARLFGLFAITLFRRNGFRAEIPLYFTVL